MTSDDDALIASRSLLREAESCWRIANATRATLLIDGEEYFGALREAFLRARSLIVIAGWDFDSRTRLPPCAGASQESREAPLELGRLLGYLVRTRPGLDVRVVRWRYHWWYRGDRETDTRARLEPLGVRYYEDGRHPPTGAVHHKIVVIDDALAFCGGIDLTQKRWDTRRHPARDPLRRDRTGAAYMPVHDTQLCVAGPIAAELGEHLRSLWPDDDPPRRATAANDLWPDGLRVDFRDIRAAIARTLPQAPGRSAVREIESFYVAAVQSVERSLYCENQYFTSTRIAEAIAGACRRRPALEGLLVGMQRPKTPAELHTMGYGLTQFHRVLSQGAAQRVSLVAALSEGRVINLHSKLAIFDDRWLTVGSANLNRRSMGFDVECNLILEAHTPEHRRRIERLRNELIGEHLGLESWEVAAEIEARGMARVWRAARGARRLEPLEPEEMEPHFGPLLAPIFDPDRQWVATASGAAALGDWSKALAPLALIVLTVLSGAFARAELPLLSSLRDILHAFMGA